MSRFVSMAVFVVLLAPAAQSQAHTPSAVTLKPEQVPPECKEVDGQFPMDMQTAILWERTEMYKGIIPVPVAKSSQSFACKGEKGTVYLYQFSSEAERKHAATFLKRVLWGESHPTEDHPELVIEGGEILTVVSFRRAPKSLLFALQSGTIPSPTNAEKNGVTDFPVPGHGSLRLNVPDGWKTQTRKVEDPASITLHSVPASGNAFDVQVTAVWLDSARLASMKIDSLRTLVQGSADALLPRAVEKTAVLNELRGPQSAGFYYVLTDRDPGSGFRYLTQGVFLTGEVLSTFTILHQTQVSPDLTQALRLFAEATYTK